jgi:phosphatidylglycerol lysyltransferase
VIAPTEIQAPVTGHGIARRHGGHSCSLQTLDPAFRHFVAVDGRASIAYVDRGAVRLAAGGPMGPGGSRAAAAAQFVADSQRESRRVLWFLLEDSAREELTAAGLLGYALQVGAQPVWSPQRFLETLRSHGSLRQQLHRAGNHGVAVREWAAQAASRALPLRRCLERWLRHRPCPPLHFLAGPVVFPPLQDRRIFVAEQGDKVVGYLLLLPVPARRGVLVEQIVRDPDAPNGTSEILLQAAAHAAEQQRLMHFTLGCSPLSVHGSSAERRPFYVRALKRCGNGSYDFDGLDRWKAKFRPAVWEPLWFAPASGSLRLGDWWALACAEAAGRPAAFLLGAVGQRLRLLVGRRAAAQSRLRNCQT